ncbi:Rad9-domain-containing protein [Irpex rosettiformis]|uniref:Rad9-domain-containing protein n=1 Tax=Irpex rosettiformis TaxID=378272 RepID=A0ACB8UCG0_9APHY|nr:Rad9-domain-containing protein [Irpex rosettiformis]
MQASLDTNSLKHVIKALTCLAKYGDDVVIYTTPESLTFSATNTTASAYCRFKYNRPFFSRFHADLTREGGAFGPQGQVNAKSLLAILKHRTVEKAAEKCELSIVEGGEHEPGTNVDDSGHDSLESRLIVRLHCKHGVVKTHRLLLHSTELVTPSLIDSSDESRLTVAPKAIKDLIEHFPFPKGPKYDPKLIWRFEEQEIFLKGQEASNELEGKSLATELSLSASEFELYDIFDPPVTICFHIREFQATLLLAEYLGLNLNIRFLDSTSPIYIEIEGDLADTLFVIATSQIIDTDAPSGSSSHRQGQDQRAYQQSRTKVIQRPPRQQGIPSGKRKRGPDGGAEDSNNGRNNIPDDADDDSLYAIRDGHANSRASSVVSPRKRPMKAAVKADRESIVKEFMPSGQRTLHAPVLSRSQALVNAIIPPPSLPRSSMPPPSMPRASVSATSPSKERSIIEGKKKEPLFLPGSQLSQAVHDSGWGIIENMDAEEFDKMMEDGDELDGSESIDTGRSSTRNGSSNKPLSSQPKPHGGGQAQDEEEDIQMQEAQNPESSAIDSHDDEEVDQLADDVDSVLPEAQVEEVGRDRESSFDLYYDETETQFGPTQSRSQGSSSAGRGRSSKAFKPLFDD